MTYGKPFTSIRVLSSGRFNARYRPRQGTHQTRTFDFQEDAENWLDSLEIGAVDSGDVSRITGVRTYQRGKHEK